MPLNENIKVEMPAHCARVPKGGKIYIQYVKRAYRNARGQPTSERVAIGRLDEASGMLIPNRNYYEIFEQKQPESAPELVRSNGVHTVFDGVCEKLGIKRLLSSAFGDRADKLLTVAQYMLSEGNVMYYLSDWQDENLSFAKERLSDEAVSRLFASVGTAERMSFFHDWIKKTYKGEYLAYDVSSISSYSKGIENLEWGYNRDREALPQINFGMYYGEESRLPLYYRIYPGSITDKAHLKYMTEDNGLLGCGRVRYVMDRGFYSADNMNFLTEKGCRFLIALPGSLKYVRELIEKHRGEIIDSSECHLGFGLPYAKAYESTELGFRMRVHLYYDPEKAARDSAELYGEIERVENELRGMEEPPDRSLHYDRYFFINRTKDGKLAYRKNYSAIDKRLRQGGFFVLAETDFNMSDKKALELYRRRDVIEKGFDDLKNGLDMRRLLVHSDDAVEGKAFCAFLALIVRSYMHNMLGDYMRKNHMTFRKLLLECAKSKLIIAPKYPTGSRQLNPHTKTMKDILALLSP